MKRCPECRRDYFDDSLIYCLDDGSSLLEGPRSGPLGSEFFGNEPPTAIRHKVPPPDEAPTRAQIHSAGNAGEREITDTIRPPRASTREQAAYPLRNRPWSATTVAVLIVAIGFGYGLYRYFSNASPRAVAEIPKANPSAHTMQISRLTTSGAERGGAISPDGRYLVSVAEKNGKHALVLKQIETSLSRELIPMGDVMYGMPVFSPDNNFIYYTAVGTSTTPDLSKISLYRVPVIGGDPMHLLEGTDWNITVSPDGSRVAYTNQQWPEGETTVNVVPVEDLLARHARPVTIANRFDPEQILSGPWSPDGTAIACVVVHSDPGKGLSHRILSLSPEGTELKYHSDQEWKSIEGMVWLNGSKELLIAARKDDPNEPSQIWRIGEDGRVSRITNDLNDYSTVSVSANNESLVATQKIHQAQLFVSGPAGPKGGIPFDAARFEQITQNIQGASPYELDLTFTPDGSLIYIADTGSGLHIYQHPEGASGAQQLTHDSDLKPARPAVSPDGRFLLFVGAESGERYLFRLDLADLSVKRLTDGPIENPLLPAPDGRYVFYWTLNVDKYPESSLWRVPIEGGTSELIRQLERAAPGTLSPDAKNFAFVPVVEGVDQWGVLPLGDPSAKPKYFLNDGNVFGIPIVPRWTPDSRCIAFLRDRKGAVNIRATPVDGATPFDVTSFRDGKILNFAFSLDGKRLAIARAADSADVVLIKNFS